MSDGDAGVAAIGQAVKSRAAVTADTSRGPVTATPAQEDSLQRGVCCGTVYPPRLGATNAAESGLQRLRACSMVKFENGSIHVLLLQKCIHVSTNASTIIALLLGILLDIGTVVRRNSSIRTKGVT